MGEAVDDATTLCLACGICCEGVLHNHAVAAPEELERIARLGIGLHEKREYPAFALPCPCHVDRCCTVYDQRPKACGVYKCSLLQAAQEGKRSFSEAHRIVEQVREVLGRIYGTIGSREQELRIWDQARNFLSERREESASEDAFRRGNAALLLDLNVLALLCGRHFEPENFEGAWTWDSVESGEGTMVSAALATSR